MPAVLEIGPNVEGGEAIEGLWRNFPTLDGDWSPWLTLGGEGESRDLVDRLVGHLTRKGFRRRVSDVRREDMARKVTSALDSGQPLKLIVPFGGYKHFWNRSAPVPDWAEVFHLDFLCKNVLPVAEALPGGVRVEYISEDFLVPMMDNYRPEDLNDYAAKFALLIDTFNSSLPASLRLEFWRLSDRFDTSEILEAVLDELPHRRADFDQQSPAEKALDLKRSQRSVNWSGWVDLTGLEVRQRHERVIAARVMEKTFSDIGFTPERVGSYYVRDLNVCVVFSWGLSPDNAEKQFLTLHSAPGSCVDHWIGHGVVIRGRSGYRRTIVSRRQYESLSPGWNPIVVDPEVASVFGMESVEVWA